MGEREDAKKAREDAKAANEAMSEEQKKAAQRAKREEAKAAKEAARAAEALRAARQAQLEKSAEDADRRLRRFNGEGSGDEALTDEDLPLMVEPPSAAAPEKRCSTTLKFDYYGVTQSVPCTGQAEVPFPSHGSQPRFCLDESSDLLGFLAKISFSKTQSTCG